VVAARGNAPEYAAALTALEQNRCAQTEAALAATGGNLMKRIRRLLYPLESPHAVLTPVLSAGILTLTAAFALMAWQATTPPQAPATPAENWVNVDVAYIITDAERTAFRSLQTDDERTEFVKQFWERRNPTPGSPDNSYRYEHYRRLAYANARFGSQSSIPGWKNDRGRIYITFGPPDEIDSHPAHPNEIAYDDWRYRWIEGIGTDVMIRFADTGGNGEYHMTKDPNPQNSIRVVKP
jgi:GWxTD domain-containing protein